MVNWMSFFLTTVIIITILFFEWPKTKKKPKKDKSVFIVLLVAGWVLSIFELPQISDPVNWLEVLFQPLGRFMD
ncbi:hypothetical protein [Bacillus thermotolerans]|uniref:hypothetical protein n=1 Tax=Bacillus thermotolerans TaxID=1221996 RepID=UPI000582DC28|nr:hypothetical protein [Bacillus thermotolerans]KKB34199.1 hypothetical protein QY97_02600 [Bacillus thermotolerans]